MLISIILYSFICFTQNMPLSVGAVSSSGNDTDKPPAPRAFCVMSKKHTDAEIIGKRFGKLLVLSFTGIYGTGTHAKRMVNCKCDCGLIKETRLGSLLSGNTTSCGCNQKPYEGAIVDKYGKYETGLLHVYHQMMSRCHDTKDQAYKYYGGRGIFVNDEWRGSFLSFYDWCISKNWCKGMEIDRKDNNAGYHPDNCRIVSKNINARNRRNNRIIEYKGLKLTMIEWAEKTGVDYDCIRHRLDSNMPLEDVFSNENHFGKHAAKAVVQFDKNGNKIKQFESAIVAAKETGIDVTSIGRVANKVPKYKSAGGFIWEWEI
jgi:hypothetical protein